MTAIVVNTLNTAVTEYDWTFQSITPTHAGSASGLFELGGTTDDGAAITGEVRTGKTLMGSSLRKAVDCVFFGLKGSGNGILRVGGEASSWEYTFPVRAGGVSRSVPGAGISENYLSFGYRNVAGAQFQLDRIDAEVVPSKQRRT